MERACLCNDKRRTVSQKNNYIEETVFKIYFSNGVFFPLWGAVYYLVESDECYSILTVLEGHYHMWFILMITGLYIITPIVRCFTTNHSIMKYYLVLAFTFASLLPTVITIMKDFGPNSISNVAEILQGNINSMYMSLPVGFTGYYIIGYYLNNKELVTKQKNIIYLFGVTGALATIILTDIISIKYKAPSSNYYGYFSLNVFLVAIAVFVWFKSRRYKNHPRMNKVMYKLSSYSFGAYLVHALILELLDTHFSLNSLSFNPMLAIPCISIIVFAISYLISYLLNALPVVNRYIV